MRTPDLIAIAAGESRRLPVADGSLRNVTHWGFCISGAVCGTRLAIETGSGVLFDVRIGARSDCCVWAVAEGDSRHRAVWLSLDSGAAGRRPLGHVTALVLKQPAGAPMLLLSGAWLARPRPGWRRDSRCVKGMPACSSAGIADPG